MSFLFLGLIVIASFFVLLLVFITRRPSRMKILDELEAPCPECGKLTDADEEKCGHCGARIKEK